MPTKEPKPLSLNAPMLIVAALICGGVIATEWLSQRYTVGLWSSLFALAMGGLLLFWGMRHHSSRHTALRWVGFGVLIFALGGVSFSTWRLNNTPPPPMQDMLWRVRILSSERLRVDSWQDDEGKWHNFSRTLYYRTDVEGGFRQDEELKIYAYWRGYRSGGFIYLADDKLIARHQGAPTPTERINRWATEQIEKLELSAPTEALTKAMVLGDKLSVEKQTLRAYRESGVMHILALSGLHLAIIYLVINAFTSWTTMLPRGYRWRFLIAIALVWIYALSVGAPSSVVRAAVMFTIYLLGRAWSLPYSGVNALASTVVLVVALNPSMVWDVGFQLSAVAVAAILLWFPPLRRAIPRSRHTVVNAIVDSMLISILCVVALTPIISTTFGYIPLLGFLCAPIILATGYLIVIFGAVWIIVPWLALQPIFTLALEGARMVQNSIVEEVASLSWGVVHFRATEEIVGMTYLLYLIVTVLLWWRGDKK